MDNKPARDVAILVSAGKLRALGRPRPNGVKLFSTVELFTPLADREWLDEATKSIGQHWRRKNERRQRTAPSGRHALAGKSAPRSAMRPATSEAGVSEALPADGRQAA